MFSIQKHLDTYGDSTVHEKIEKQRKIEKQDGFVGKMLAARAWQPELSLGAPIKTEKTISTRLSSDSDLYVSLQNICIPHPHHAY